MDKDKLKTRLAVRFGMILAAAVMLWTAWCFAPISIEVKQDEPAAVTASQAAEKEEPGLTAKEEDINSTPAGAKEIIKTACSLIEKGKFDAAGQLIEADANKITEANEVKSVKELKGIIGKWDGLQKKRDEQKEAAYKEQLANFEKVIKGVPLDSNDKNVSANTQDETNEKSEVNEPNFGPTVIIAGAIRANEFADANEKKAILNDPCLREAVETAKKKSAELESRGKWLDAYIRYASLLAALEPNNKNYTEHSDQLIEKAEIVGVFTDNPCETVKQRFTGVKRRIFERAVDELNFRYISKIDYRDMAQKGLRRCKALGEVVQTLMRQDGQLGEPNLLSLGESFKEFEPNEAAITKYNSGLNYIAQEVNDWSAGGSKEKFLELFGKVLGLNLDTAKLPEGVLISEFAEASFAALDPYTVIVWPTNVADFEKIMTNEFSGIGIEIMKQKGQLTVGSLLPDTPAYKAGLDAGDVIESVDGMATKDMPLPCAVKYITGPAGTKVKLMVKHEGEQQAKEFVITRAKIVVPTIRGWERTEEGNWRYMVDSNDNIGYIRVTSFSEKTAEDLEEAMDSLEIRGMRGLIVDLRNNSGGFFDSAVNVCDLFLDSGIIVVTRARFGLPAYSMAHKKGTHPNYPLVVLINSGSASASEIVAGSLADPTHKRAILVGERTHGKGVVQGVTEYPGEGAQLKYTMAYYQLPSGQRVKSKEEAEKDKTGDWGVAPNVPVELRSDELRKMFDIQRDNDVLVKAGHDKTAAPVKKHTLEETIEADPQLETGIMVIKGELVCFKKS